ncbi:MAG: dockerin type I domain-containing protein, partial [Proteobacteria bacterium]|nr:dockerin type I domain-containing protein [Pseudomonadota bacterium]
VAYNTRSTKKVSIKVNHLTDNFGTSTGYHFDASQDSLSVSFDPLKSITEDALKVYFAGAHYSNPNSSLLKSSLGGGQRDTIIANFVNGDRRYKQSCGMRFSSCEFDINFDAQSRPNQFVQKLSFPYKMYGGQQGVENKVLEINIAGSAVQTPYAWTNKANKFDVDGDGGVSPLDVLTLINELNKNGARELSTSGPGASTTTYYDVDSDGSISPLDALSLINNINNRQN